MTAEQSEGPHHEQRGAFFRQSGWLMIANIINGLFMLSVHFLSKKVPPSEYGIFGTLLAVTMCVPMIPMQMVMAQQTAQAIATNRLGELAGIIRWFWMVTALLCLVVAGVVLMFQNQILGRWQIGNPAGLWLTLVVIPLSLWFPMFCGVLQGRQNFMWLGWSMILSAIGRAVVAALMVFLIAGNAAGMMTGVLLGFITGNAVALWQTRSFWTRPPVASDKRALVRQIVPLMVGFAALQFLFTADTMFVKAYFPADDTGFYVAAGTMSRALMWLVTPLAMVMFPKIVHSTTKSQKSNLMGMVLLGTALLAACGAVGLWVVGSFFVKIIYKEAYVAVTSSLLPWYAWAMLPLSVANVLLNNLLARLKFGIVAPLVILAIAYGFALTRFNDSLKMVLQTMGVFNILLLAVTGWFSWRNRQGPDDKEQILSAA
jgi:O-antigen/teichoic acid export membrane protein